MSPRCSVIIPAYNVEDYVAEAVESALSQQRCDAEVIVVNDGSTDRTAEAVRPYLGSIRYIEQENRGLAGARNTALREATGEYIALLDADDVWMPERLDRMVSYLDTNGQIGFATSDAYLLNERTRTTTRFYEWVPMEWRFHSTDQIYWILQTNYIFVMTVVRRALFDRFGVFDESLRSCEDWDLWLRFLVGGERVGLVDEPLAYYRVRAGSLSRDKGVMYEAQETILQRALSRPEVRDTPGLAGSVDLARGTRALTNGSFDEASRYLKAASADRDLPVGRRLKARLAAAVPRSASRLHGALRRLRI